VSKCEGGPTKTSSRKLTTQHPRRVTADLHCNCNIAIAILSKKFSLYSMIWCRAVRQGLCTVKIVFFFNGIFLFLNFQSSTATGSSDVYSISKVNILKYILIRQFNSCIKNHIRRCDFVTLTANKSLP
jgi:hypothetical protein